MRRQPNLLSDCNGGARTLNTEKGRTMGLFRTTKRTLVVDIAALLKAKGARGRAAPRQQLQVLRSLSRLVQRENMNVTAVLAGPLLNKAPHNKKLDGVRVRYAKSDDKLNSQLRKALAQAGDAGVLVTEDVELENKVIRTGRDTLRISTFRKLLDDGNEPLSNQGGSTNRGNHRSRNNRRDRDRTPRPQGKSARPKKDRPDKERKKQAEDEISQMIDLVE